MIFAFNILKYNVTKLCHQLMIKMDDAEILNYILNKISVIFNTANP